MGHHFQIFESVNLASSFRQTKRPHLISFFMFLILCSSHHQEDRDCLETVNDEALKSSLCMCPPTLNSYSRSYDSRDYVSFLKRSLGVDSSCCVVATRSHRPFFWLEEVRCCMSIRHPHQS